MFVHHCHLDRSFLFRKGRESAVERPCVGCGIPNRSKRTTYSERRLGVCLDTHRALLTRHDTANNYAEAAVRRDWKHSRQNTGRPCVGRNGTVVCFPHPEHVACVSTLL